MRVVELGRGGTWADTSPRAVSSHGGEPAELLRLAGTLGTAPGRVVLVGIEGSDYGHGAGLSEPARRGVAQAAEVVGQMLDSALAPSP